MSLPLEPEMKVAPGLHPEMHCAYCGEQGCVTITQSKGTIGPGLDKGSNGWLTGGIISWLVDGLMRKQTVTFANCEGCMMSWKYTRESVA
jgi:hypothetical protein